LTWKGVDLQLAAMGRRQARMRRVVRSAARCIEFSGDHVHCATGKTEREQGLDAKD
jgi:hypothetical protein